MGKNTVNYVVETEYDLGEYLNGFKVVDVSIGPMGEICVLAVHEIPERIDGMFSPVQTNRGHDYKAILLTEGHIEEVIFRNQKWNYHFIQPIDENNILLACGRARLYENGEFDRNAKIFNKEGFLLREFLLGDGIQNLYVTKENHIWTSYFDEGVFGNYGWEELIGRYGLRAWDSHGKEMYKYPNSNDHFIDDCYALNVVSDEEVWFYFYSDFELGRYDRGRLDYFKPDVAGADGFILYEDYFLFRGGYGDQDQYILYQMDSGHQLRRKVSAKLFNKDKKAIYANLLSCRGSLLLLATGTKVYLLDLQDFLSAITISQ